EFALIDQALSAKRQHTLAKGTRKFAAIQQKLGIEPYRDMICRSEHAFSLGFSQTTLRSDLGL
ncbi:hypothetical protein, partial [uncultured Pseudomonas sp.]|uniref:hypothetical protein n=1 Tax=uncultured Pseudomonas sp. TaxID=114707 RepID=UPI00260D92FF